MDPVAMIGLALFAAAPAGYPFARESHPRATEAMAYGGAVRPHRGEAELPRAEASESSATAELSELLRRCAAGDRSAFRRLYELQTPRLYAVALRITRQSALAADAVHDALLQVWQNAGRFDINRGNPEAWLLSLVRYRALDIARRNVREVTGVELPESEDQDPDPLSRLIGTTEGEALQRCLQKLEADRRQLVMLAFLDGLSHTELAAKLNQPLGTVKSWIRRALLSLKRCLDQ
jgi:RNA polymerase sigma-70 factor (ECF subfamily)